MLIEKLTVLLLLAASLTNLALARLTNCAPCVAVAAVANPYPLKPAYALPDKSTTTPEPISSV